jgi:hypothetical protein
MATPKAAPEKTTATATAPTAKKPAAAKAATAKKPAVAKKPAAEKKPAATKKPAAAKANKVGPEERYRMVEVAAYFLAERSSFKGNPVDYWTAAEIQISKLLAK